MKIGIVGGTFDPFHRGHLEPVLAIRGLLSWSSILYIPAHQQPFKTDRVTTSGHHRFAMAVLATEELEEVFVSPRELERGAVSYTVETLELLRKELPGATLDWIIGDDNLADLPKWKNIERIFELANFVVLARGGVPATSYGDRVTDLQRRPRHGAIVFARNDTVPVSATEIRRKLRAGEPIGDLVDPRVSRYIQHYGLYQEDQRERLH